MQSLTVVELLKQVVTSWQVIAVTIAIVLYLQLVFLVTRKRRGPSKIHKMSAKPAKVKAKSEPAAIAPEEAGAGKSSNEELGLEEK